MIPSMESGNHRPWHFATRGLLLMRCSTEKKIQGRRDFLDGCRGIDGKENGDSNWERKKNRRESGPPELLL